jgi:hypothetical protein
VQATVTGPPSYQWLRNGRRVLGATESSFEFPAVTDFAGRWECTVNNACGSVGSCPATVTVVHPGEPRKREPAGNARPAGP